MPTIPSPSIMNILGMYRISYDMLVAAEQEDAKRFQALSDFLDLDLVPESKQKKKAAEGDPKEIQRAEETRREEEKQKRLTGQKGMQEAFAKVFRKMLFRYMPGGFFRDESINKIADEFYRRAYTRVKSLLPKTVAQLLRDKNITDVNASNVQPDPETINKIITDMVLEFKQNPGELETALGRAFSKKEQEGEDSGRGIAEGYFRPVIGDEEYKRRREEANKEGEEYDGRPGDIDDGVLDNLEDRSEVKWKLVKIDERGRLYFTLPDLYGNRIFQMQLPADIQNIRPGTYTFKVNNVGKRGASLEFVEQAKDIRKDTLNSLEEDGLGPDQMKKLIDQGFVRRYMQKLETRGIEKLLEDLGGVIAVGDKQIGSVDDLAELSGTEGVGGLKQTRGEKKKKEQQEKAKAQQYEKTRAMVDAWGRDIARLFLRFKEPEGKAIAEAVSNSFPATSEKGVPSLLSTLATKPIVNLVLQTIMDPTTPLGGKKSAPWVSVAYNKILEAIKKDPAVRAQFENLAKGLRGKAKDPKFTSEEITDPEIEQTIKRYSNGQWRKAFSDLKSVVKEKMLSMKGDPSLQRFFGRREQFQNYIKPQLEDYIEGILESEKLDPAKSEDAQILEKYKEQFINKAIKRMTKPLRSASNKAIIKAAFERVRVGLQTR